MKEVFLVRLYKHSRLGFISLVLFAAGYAWFLHKKMDMMFFPFNAMFAYSRSGDEPIIVYRLACNGKPVNYTHFPYWKKDFMETSLRVYAHYLRSGQKVYVEQYIREKWGQEGWAGSLIRALSPVSNQPAVQLAWYARFAGVEPRAGDQLSLWSYRLGKDERQGLHAVDSVVVLQVPAS